MSGNFTAWTLSRYERAVLRLCRLKAFYLGLLLIGTLVAAILTYRATSFWQAAPIFAWIPLVWLISVPMFIVATWGFFKGIQPGELLFLQLPPDPNQPIMDVIFMLATLGTAPETVSNSMASVDHWTRQHPELSFRSHRWVVIEQRGYEANREPFDRMASSGVRLLVVPESFTTPNGTTKKARALYFATEQRRREFPDAPNTWVYHHDDETALGEDAILGIEEFVRMHRFQPVVGPGIIIYDQNFSWRSSQVQELTRTSNDINNLPFLSKQNNPSGNFHGSHYIVRSDVEDRIDWDMGPNQTAEDLYFDVLSRAAGVRYAFLRGFAHEQAPLNVRDQLRQRRRWIHGIFSVYRRYRDQIPEVRRFTISYGMALWIAASFSLPALIISLIFHVSVLLTSVLMGFIWVSMFENYHRSWVLHAEYVDKRWTPGAILSGIIGAFADSFAPWYAFATKPTKTFDVIRKDVSFISSQTPWDDRSSS